MPIFSMIPKNNTVSGPHSENIKITFENICNELNDERYSEGIDTESTIETLEDIYNWLLGISRGRAIRLPAPVADTRDRYRTMWPEGSRVVTRERRGSRRSDTSSVASGADKVRALSRAYTASSRNSSVISARYAPVRNTFIEEDEPITSGFRRINLHDMADRSKHVKQEPDKVEFEDVVVPEAKNPRQGSKRSSKSQQTRFADDD